MFLILFSNQRGLFSAWGTLSLPPSTEVGLEPRRLAPTGVSSGCVYQTTVFSAPRAFGGPGGTRECWSFFFFCVWFMASPYAPRDLRVCSTDQCSSQVHGFAMCGSVVTAVCLHAQLEMFWPPHPVDRDCWFQGWSSHQMLRGTASIFKCLFVCFPLSLSAV